VLFNGGCLARFFKISSSTLEPNLYNSVVYSMTHAPQPRSPSPSPPAAGSSSHVDRQCPGRGLHAPESLLLFGPCVGHIPPYLAVHDVGWGSKVVDLRLGGIGDSACPPHAAVSGGTRCSPFCQ
jgi:hypothetical protein